MYLFPLAHLFYFLVFLCLVFSDFWCSKKKTLKEIEEIECDKLKSENNRKFVACPTTNQLPIQLLYNITILKMQFSKI